MIRYFAQKRPLIFVQGNQKPKTTEKRLQSFAFLVVKIGFFHCRNRPSLCKPLAFEVKLCDN